MSQAQIKELEDMLLDISANDGDLADMEFLLSEIDALTGTLDKDTAKKPKGRGEIAQANKQKAINNVSEQARVDPAGTIYAISQGINQGIFNLLDLPGDIVNLAIDGVNGLAGGTYIPPHRS